MVYLVVRMPQLKSDKGLGKDCVGTYLTQAGVECERQEECLVAMNRTAGLTERLILVQKVPELAAAVEV